MEYSSLVSVTGFPGIHELISTKTDGAVVRFLADNTTRFVSSRIHQLTFLESIEVYTTGENVNLVEIFNAIEKNNDSLPDEKDAEAVKTYFQKTYPDMDYDRVYGSDLKKILKWYVELKKNNIEIKLSELPEEAVDTEPEAAIEGPEATAEKEDASKKSAKKK